jgi:hypothetical protein
MRKTHRSRFAAAAAAVVLLFLALAAPTAALDGPGQGGQTEAGTCFDPNG